MGQRHQLFVIAKIGNRYRGLAAIHHQWLYGATALRRCLGILSIFSAPINRLPIQQELAMARTCDSEVWDGPPSYDKIHVPFPFITTCLVLGASFDIRQCYNAVVTPEPFNLPFNGGDNNDGITVIDVTDLDHVRYCFVLWDGCDVFYNGEDEDSQSVNVPQMTPLSGPLYLGAYYSSDIQEERVDLQELVRDFEVWDLISADALRSAWPEGDWRDSLSHGEHLFAVAISSLEMYSMFSLKWRKVQIELVALTLASLDKPASQHAPGLRASAMAQLIDTTLQQLEVDPSWMPEAELMPDFLPAVKAKLLSDPTLLVTSPAAKILLPKIIEHEQDVDLSLFQNLTTEQLSHFTCKLSKTIVSLSLSGPNITADLLRRIASANPSLRKVYILGASNVPLQPTLELLHKSNLDAIYHSDMFRRSLEDVAQKEISFPSQIMTSFPVIQIFWVRREFDRGLERTYTAAFPLRDAILPPARVVTGLAKFLHFLTTSGSWSGRNEESTVAMVAAKSFAMTSSADFDVLKQVEINPLPAELYRAAKNMHHHSGAPPPSIQNLKHGEWTLVIVHKGHPGTKELRYAFITTPTLGASALKASDTIPEGECCNYQETQINGEPSAETDTDQARSIPKVTIADMKSFLEKVVPEGQNPSGAQKLYKHWLEQTKVFVTEGFGVCDEQEIDGIIEEMTTYSKRWEK